MTFLVVGNHTQGLSVIRSLGVMGIHGHVLYDKKVCLSRFSKYTTSFTCTKKHAISRAFLQENHQPILSSMLSLVPDGEKWVLYGVNEDVIEMFYEHQDVLREKFLFPETSVENIVDKYRFAAMAERVGVCSPATFLLSEAAEKMQDGHYYVAKGRQGNKFRSLANLKGKIIDNLDDLQPIRDYVKGRLDESEVIIQEIIEPGDDARVRSFAGFAIEGEPYAEFQYEKVRQSPDQFGTGTYCKSIWDEELAVLGRRIIKELSYTGVYEIEFLRNTDGVNEVIEMNPRTWKSVGLAVASNRNLAYYYYQYLRNETMPSSDNLGEYLTDKLWAHVVTDFVFMLKNRRLDFGYKDMVFCDYDRNDLKPFLAEIFLAPLIAAKI